MAGTQLHLKQVFLTELDYEGSLATMPSEAAKDEVYRVLAQRRATRMISEVVKRERCLVGVPSDEAKQKVYEVLAHRMASRVDDQQLYARPHKRQRLTPPTRRQPLPRLPSDALQHILKYVRLRDIHNARQTCKEWRDAIDTSAAAIWEAKCHALDLLPEDRCSVLGACTEETIREVRDLRLRIRHLDGNLNGASSCESEHDKQSRLRAVLVWQVGNAYRVHFLRWVRHVCVKCEPITRDGYCEHCTPSNTFKWFRRLHTIRPLNLISFSSLRAVHCERPPHAPLSWEMTRRFFRWDDMLRAVRRIPYHAVWWKRNVCSVR